MFISWFGNKNNKLVKVWITEHEAIVSLANKVMNAYTEKDNVAIKKHLESLRELAINHIMMEDIEFFRILKDENRLNPEIETSITLFKESFREIKTLLRNFLLEYTIHDAVYDKKFFASFNTLVAALDSRIKFEEKNLYKLLTH